MKIGLVCPYNIAKGGGVQEHVLACQTELRRRGHDAYIITPRLREDVSVPSKHIVYIGTQTDFKSPLHTTVQVSAGVNNSIDEVLATHNFDILHFHEPWVPMLSAQILSRSKCVNVATFHAKLPETIMTRTMIRVVTPYTKSVLKYIDAFTAVSEAAAEYVCSLTDEPVTLIPNGIDLKKYAESIKEPRKQAGGKNILYIGRLERRKGVKHLLYAYSLLCERDATVTLTIAGDGPDRQKLEDLAADLELPRVTFLGYISNADKIRLLRNADLFCSPALYGESFGIVLLEAMATGTVTVAGDNPGYASVLNGVGALSLVDPRHHMELSRRLELLLGQQELRDLWLEWARTNIGQYNYTKIIDRYEAVYSEALANHSTKVLVNGETA